MKTLSFIGSDKNAGKTTVLNFVYGQLSRQIPNRSPICLTSIGINGEDVDLYENRTKPGIKIFRDDYFITAGEHLAGLTGKYQTVRVFLGNHFTKPYVLGRAQMDLKLVLEGPNDKTGILSLKQHLQAVISNGIFMVDGSIDRQFLAHPQISDQIFFAVLLSARKEQQQKTKDFLYSLCLKECQNQHKVAIRQHLDEKRKSIFLNKAGELLYKSNHPPFLDGMLKKTILESRNNETILYLNGALSKSLYAYLSPFSNLTVILDNFTLYQNVSVRKTHVSCFKPSLLLLQSVRLKRIFLNRETDELAVSIPQGLKVNNLFREDIHEIRA